MEPQILRLNEVKEQTRLSKATIYRMLARGEFPRPISLTDRLRGWRRADIDNWLESRESA